MSEEKKEPIGAWLSKQILDTIERLKDANTLSIGYHLQIGKLSAFEQASHYLSSLSPDNTEDFGPGDNNSEAALLVTPHSSVGNSIEQAYENYISVLVDEINDLIGMASIHGWKSRNVERGEQARQEIQRIKSNQ
jgi:hypothetical protein